jgi:hypothetical protein
VADRSERRDIPDLRKLDGEVAQENEHGALHLFLDRGDFVLLDLVAIEVGDAVDDDPGQRAAKVDGFVHDKGHDARGEHVVLHEGVPGGPHLLEVVELGIGGGDLVEGGPVLGNGIGEDGGGVAARSC